MHEHDSGGQRVDHRVERKERRRKREESERDEGHVRKTFRRMEARKRRQKIAVARRRVRHARGAEKQAVGRCERGDQDRNRHDDRHGVAGRAFHGQRGDERRVYDVVQRQRRENAEVECDVSDPDDHDRDDDRARDRAHRRDDLIADLADVVVAGIVVEREYHGRAEPGNGQSARRKRRPDQRSHGLRRMNEAAGGDRDEREHGDAAQHERRARDVGDRPVEREQHDEADHEGDRVRDERLRRGRNDIRGILGEADVAAGQRQRRHEQKLPNEHERGEPAGPVRAERLAQIRIRTTAARKARG